MLKFRATIVVVLALTCATSGVAAADPVPLPDVVRPVDTVGCATDPPENCLHFTVALRSMSINSVPNMAATAFTREAFISGMAEVTVAGDDPKWYTRVKNMSILLGFQMGCQIILGNNQQIGGLGGGSIPITSLPLPNAGVFFGPGGITSFEVATKKVTKDEAKTLGDMDDEGKITLRVYDHERQVNADSCAGPVSLRLIATARVETFDDNEGAGAFGDIVQI